VLYKLGRYDEARNVMRKALMLDTTGSDALLMHYGDILFALKELFMAETYWQKAVTQGYDKEAMEAHPESLLHKIAAENGGVEGRTAFDAAEAGDETALAVCKQFVEYLAAGVTNLVNILQPEVLAVGGGVAGAPDHLLMEPLRKIVEEECYPRHTGNLPRILRAELGNDAGIIGAALLSRAI
jgi:glucokinase